MFFILAYFCPFTLLTAQKMKIQKNERNIWNYYYFIQVYPKLLFNTSLPSYPPLTMQKMKTKKKKPGDI